MKMVRKNEIEIYACESMKLFNKHLCTCHNCDCIECSQSVNIIFIYRYNIDYYNG